MLSAQQLEAGASGLTGRLGDGTGRWQLFVASGGTIEVMSLMQNPNGHLSNVSATPRGAAATTEFRIVAEGATTVRPLETVVLTVPGGLGNSDYTVLMDLSGTGTFRQADTIEAEGLTTDRNRILFATPFTQMLADANRSHRLAVRVRRETDKALSPVLRFSVDDISVATEQVGFPSIMLETVLKSLYESADDPLLKLDAVSIQPGWLAHSARRLGLDTTYSDVQAEAILQSLFGMPVTEPASGPRTRASAAGFTSRPPAADALGFPFRKSSPRLRCRTVTDLTIGQTEVCDFVEKQQSCWSNWHDPDFGVDEFNASSRCSMEVVEPGELRKLTGQVAGQLAINWTVGKIGTLIKAGGQRVLRHLSKTWSDVAMVVVSELTVAKNHAVNSMKVGRAFEDGQSGGGDRSRHFDSSGGLTRRGLESVYENLRAIIQSAKEEIAKFKRQAEMDFSGRKLNDEQRDSFWSIVNESDRQRREAEEIDDLEGVYLGDEEPLDAIGSDPGGGVAVADGCEVGYEEFPLDDETSTCVFESLVEPRCYAGSRRVREPDLGGANVCLYYSLDFYQPNGKCRQNYADVLFQGRPTCRWAELGSNQAAWYTLYKVPDDDSPRPIDGAYTHCVMVTQLEQSKRCALGVDPDPPFPYGFNILNSCGIHVLVSLRWSNGAIESLGVTPGDTHYCALFRSVNDRIVEYCAGNCSL